MDGIDMFLEPDGDSSIEKHGWPINWMMITKSWHGKMGGNHPTNPSIHFKLVILWSSKWRSHLFGVLKNEVLFKFKWKNTHTQQQCESLNHSNIAWMVLICYDMLIVWIFHSLFIPFPEIPGRPVGFFSPEKKRSLEQIYLNFKSGGHLGMGVLDRFVR